MGGLVVGGSLMCRLKHSSFIRFLYCAYHDGVIHPGYERILNLKLQIRLLLSRGPPPPKTTKPNANKLDQQISNP